MSMTVIGILLILSSHKRVHKVQEYVDSKNAIVGLWELSLLLILFTEVRLPDLGKPFGNETESRRLSHQLHI